MKYKYNFVFQIVDFGNEKNKPCIFFSNGSFEIKRIMEEVREETVELQEENAYKHAGLKLDKIYWAWESNWAEKVANWVVNGEIKEVISFCIHIVFMYILSYE